MARIRTIKPKFFRHVALFEAEIESGLPLRVAFAGLWTAADREGRFAWSPLELKLDCLPFDDVDFSRVLDALTTRGFIVPYTAPDGRKFGAIPSWKKHQVINNREAPSEIPEPLSDDLSVSSTRDTRVLDACATPLVHAQGEGKGREGERKGREVDHAPALRGALIQSPGVWSRLHSGHVTGFCTWMCLPQDDFTRFSTRLGGDDKAQAWAESVRASGIVPTGKPWTFWNEQFDAAHGGETRPSVGGFSKADWDAHMPGGAIDRKLGLA